MDGLMLTSWKKNALKLCQRAYRAGAGDLTDFVRNPRNRPPPPHPSHPCTIHQPPSAEHRCNHPSLYGAACTKAALMVSLQPAAITTSINLRGSGRRGPNSCGMRREIRGWVAECAVISQPSQTGDRLLLVAHNPVCFSLTCSFIYLFIFWGAPFRTLPPRPAVIPDHESLKLPL